MIYSRTWKRNAVPNVAETVCLSSSTNALIGPMGTNPSAWTVKKSVGMPGIQFPQIENAKTDWFAWSAGELEKNTLLQNARELERTNRKSKKRLSQHMGVGVYAAVRPPKSFLPSTIRKTESAILTAKNSMFMGVLGFICGYGATAIQREDSSVFAPIVTLVETSMVEFARISRGVK
jgi:hypothetical protein